MTKKGMLVAVETKGDHLVDEKTIDKLALGRIWQDKAGNDKFAYYMVYQHNDLGIAGAYYLDKFMEIIKAL